MIARTLRGSENKRFCIVHLYSSRVNYGIGYTNSRHNLAGEAKTYKFNGANHPIWGALSFLLCFFRSRNKFGSVRLTQQYMGKPRLRASGISKRYPAWHLWSITLASSSFSQAFNFRRSLWLWISIQNDKFPAILLQIPIMHYKERVELAQSKASNGPKKHTSEK